MRMFFKEFSFGTLSILLYTLVLTACAVMGVLLYGGNPGAVVESAAGCLQGTFAFLGFGGLPRDLMGAVALFHTASLVFGNLFFLFFACCSAGRELTDGKIYFLLCAAKSRNAVLLSKWGVVVTCILLYAVVFYGSLYAVSFWYWGIALPLWKTVNLAWGCVLSFLTFGSAGFFAGAVVRGKTGRLLLGGGLWAILNAVYLILPTYLGPEWSCNPYGAAIDARGLPVKEYVLNLLLIFFILTVSFIVYAERNVWGRSRCRQTKEEAE
jgi:ABC-type transport system involved in multi-copper enzyme maturation permease subunit